MKDSINAERWIEKGNEYLKEKKYEDALECYNKVIEIDPKYADAWNNKGSALFGLGEYKEAVEAYEKAIGIDPKHYKSWYNRGNALYQLGEYKEAVEAYEKAIGIDPEYAKAWNNKGSALFGLGEYKEAVEAYEKAIGIDPEYAKAWHNRGNALYQLGEYREAVEAYEKAIGIDPEYADTSYNKGNIHYRLGEYREAVEAYEKAIETDPKHYKSWYNKGIVLYYRLKDHEEAVNALKKAAQINKEDASSCVKLGEIYFANGDLKSARTEAEEAHNRDKNNADALLLKGLIKIEDRNYDCAIKCIEEANNLSLGDPRFFIWSAYVRYLKAETCLYMEDKKQEDEQESGKDKNLFRIMRELRYKEDMFKIIRELEKAENLSKKNTEKEARAWILYLLGHFYYKCEDVFTAKERLEECINLRSTKEKIRDFFNLKPKPSIERRACELLGIIWNYKINPTWWNWWWSSPLHSIWKKALFSLITALIIAFSLMMLFPQSFSLTGEQLLELTEETIQTEETTQIGKTTQTEETIQTEETTQTKRIAKTNLLPLGTIIGLLILALFLPNIESIRAKGVEIELRSPPSIELFLSPWIIREVLTDVNV